MTLNAYGYVRVSTRSQTLDSQTDAIKKYCAIREINLVKIFEDTASGKDTDRKGFQAMKSALDKNPQQIGIIVSTKFDRIARSLRDLLSFVDWCDKSEIAFCAIDNNVDTSLKEGRLFLYLMGALAEFERELILERTETGRKRYLANGGKLGKPKLKIPTDEIKRLKAEGVPISKIAERFNVCRDTIYGRLSG